MTRARLDLRDPATWRGPYVRRRHCYTRHECCLCAEPVRLDEDYLERSDYRAHVRCAEALGAVEPRWTLVVRDATGAATQALGDSGGIQWTRDRQLLEDLLPSFPGAEIVDADTLAASLRPEVQP